MNKKGLYFIIIVILSVLIFLLSCTFKNPVDPGADIGKVDSLKFRKIDDSRIRITWFDTIKDFENFTYVLERKDNLNNQWEVVIPPTDTVFLDTTYVDSMLRYQDDEDRIIYTYKLYGKYDEHKTNIIEDTSSTFFPKPQNFTGEQKGQESIYLQWSQEIFTDNFGGYIIERKDCLDTNLVTKNNQRLSHRNQKENEYKKITEITDTTVFDYTDSTLSSDYYLFSYRIKAFTNLDDTLFNESMYSYAEVKRKLMTVSKDSIAFGKLFVNESSAPQPIVLKNLSDSIITVSELTLSGDDANQYSLTSGETPFTLVKNESRTIYITFSPLSGGLKIAQLEIVNDIPDQTKLSYYVILNGEGIIGNLEIEPPDSLLFDYVSVEQSKTRTLTLKNSGTAPLSIDSIYVIGSDNEYFTKSISFELPYILMDSTEINFDVIFTPDEIREFNARLIISDDLHVGSREEYEIILQGSGAKGELQINPPDSLIFGKVLLNNTANEIVTLKNIGLDTLIITNLDITGSDDIWYYTIWNTEHSINPGDSVFIDISFKPLSIGNTEATLIIVDNLDKGERNINYVTIKGEGVLGNLTIDPSSISFGDVIVDSTVTDTMTLTNDGTAPLVIESVTNSGIGDFSYTLDGWATPHTLGVGDAVEIQMSLKPSVTGIFSDTLTIMDNLPDGDKAIYNIPLSGTGILGNLTIDPSSISFGDVIVDSTVTDTVTLTNDGTAPLVIESISISRAEFTFEPLTPMPYPLSVGESIEVLIHFTPTDTVDYNGTLTIEDDLPNGIKEVYQVDLTGSGILGHLSIEPAILRLPFGSVIVDSTKTDIVTLTNDGTGPLVIESVTNTGSGDFSYSLEGWALPHSLGIQDTVEIAVSYTPTDAGTTDNGTLTIEDNLPDGNKATYDIRLSGTGILAPRGHQFVIDTND